MGVCELVKNGDAKIGPNMGMALVGARSPGPPKEFGPGPLLINCYI